jgi:hypothetical protein
MCLFPVSGASKFETVDLFLHRTYITRVEVKQNIIQAVVCPFSPLREA